LVVGTYLLFGAWDLVLLIICVLRSALINRWERDDKFRSEIDFTSHLYFSAVLFDNILRNG
jgi:hypothetical protein